MISMCPGVMYSGEKDVCDVTLIPTQGNLKNILYHGRNQTYDLCNAGQLSYVLLIYHTPVLEPISVGRALG